MCGINGIIQINNQNTAAIHQMNRALAHRGPDDEGTYIHESIALGQRRLSIIDLSSGGHQPMCSDDGNLVLVFNGEIYNFQEIRNELKGLGYIFRSNCDTEVVLYAWQQWGSKAFARFSGMFALAIYDKVGKTIVLARDYAGIKPLYYSLSDNRLLFSSEIRGFKAIDPNWKANPDWEIYFLSFGFVPSPHTTLKDVFILPKGSFLTVDLSGKMKSEIESFHRFQFTETIRSEKEASQQVRETLTNAVNRHLIADAPLGIFLSGGIDSSLCALIADHLGHQDLNTLSITFKEASFSEKSFQDIVLQRMRPHNHLEYKVNGSMFMEHLDDIFQAMDQPSWDGVNSYFISKCAHEAGLKAVLSGIGGDELFGGYPSFRRIGMLNKLSHLPGLVKSMVRYAPNNALARLIFLNANTNYKDYLFLRGAFVPSTVSEITGIPEKMIYEGLAHLSSSDYPVTRNMNLAAYLESNVYMENQLLKDTDYMSMWHSLEVRVPFLDKQLMELMHAIHPSVKFQFSQPKYLLTKAFKDLLPDEIVFRKKMGFTFPFSIWLKDNIDHFKAFLPDTPVTKGLIAGFLEGRVHWSRLWALMVWKKFSI